MVIFKHFKFKTCLFYNNFKTDLSSLFRKEPVSYVKELEELYNKGLLSKEDFNFRVQAARTYEGKDLTFDYGEAVEPDSSY